MNIIQKLQYSHPKIWALLSLIPFLFATLIIFPISFLFDLACELPRIFMNFWRDFKSSFKQSWKENFFLVKEMWKIWFNNLVNKS